MSVRKRQSDTSVDCELGKRGVWLVKVPRYLSEQWQQQPYGREVGRLETNPARTSDIIFRTTVNRNAVVSTQPASPSSSSSSSSLAQKSSTPIQLPQEHKFVFTDGRMQTMAVVSEGINREII